MSISLFPFDHRASLAAQRKLFRLCFPENEGSPIVTDDHYFWKFHSFPSETNSFEYGLSEGSELLGYYAAIPYRYKMGGTEYTAGMVCDVMTHPEARGKGLFTKIGFFATDDLQKSGIHFTTGYPIRPEVIPGHIKVGWKILFDLPMYMRFLKSNASLAEKKLGWLAPLANTAFAGYNLLLTKRISSHATINTLTREQFLELPDYESFFKTWSAARVNVLLKSKIFLSWRTGAPGTTYQFTTVRKNNQLSALVITRKTILQNVPCLAVLDWMVLPDAEECQGALHQTLYNLSKKLGVEALVTMMNPSYARETQLFSNGFIRSPFKFSLIVKKLDPHVEDEKLQPEKNWSLMWVDSDDL